ncbi:MAG: hypothetical protein WA634_19255 [Silvibacterium sp.]
MKINPLRSSISGFAAVLLAVPVLAVPSYAATQTAPQGLQLVSASAQLTHRVDSKNAMQGQVVTAKLTSNVKSADAMELPKGTLLIGKVEHVQMSTQNGPARISLVFTKARLENGHMIPIKATLLGAYPSDAGDSYSYTGVGGPMIGVQPHFIPYNQKVDQEPGTLNHVAMHSAVQSNASGVFTSKDRNIDLKQGTQLQIAIAPRTSSVG